MDTHTSLRKRAGWPECAERSTGSGAPAERADSGGPPRPQPAVARTHVGETPQGRGKGAPAPMRGREGLYPHQSWRKELGVPRPWGSPEKGHAFGGAAHMKLPKKAQQATLPAGRGEPHVTPQFLPRRGATSHRVQHHSKFSRPT